MIATAIVGDGEAETGPLATSWQSNKFLNPITDGAVLPILHLNGYKISNPTIFSRIPHDEIESFFKGCGWKPYFVEGDDPMTMHKKMAETMDTVIEEIKAIQKNARENNNPERPVWPMIVLRTPKGWTDVYKRQIADSTSRNLPLCKRLVCNICNILLSHRFNAKHMIVFTVIQLSLIHI